VPFKKLRPAMQAAIVLPLLASSCDRYIPDTDIQTTETQPKATETYPKPSATVAPANTEEVIPTEEAIPLPWIERMNEAKMQQDAMLIDKADWTSFEEINNLEPLSVAGAVQNHRGALRDQGLQTDDYDFNLFAQDNDWAVIVEEKKTGKMLWSTNPDGTLNFRPDTMPYDKDKGLVLYNEFDFTPTPSGQHGESRSIVIKNGEVFVFYKNDQGERTAVFNLETGKMERWKDTLYLAGAEALARVQDVRYEKVAENSWEAIDAQGNTLAKLEEGRDRWFYTEKGLEAITPEEEELKAFFDEHADPRSYLTVDNIIYYEGPIVKAVGYINTILYSLPIQAKFPDKELVHKGESKGDVYTLIPGVLKWKGKVGEEKYYYVYFNAGMEGFSKIALGPGVIRNLDMEDPDFVRNIIPGKTKLTNSYVAYDKFTNPSGWSREVFERSVSGYDRSFPGCFEMVGLFGEESYDALINFIKEGKDLPNPIVVGPSSGYLKVGQ
jgi:hypothetical protein